MAILNDLNDTTLFGEVTGGNEVRYLTSGMAVLDARLLVVTSYEREGQLRETPSDLPITLWGKKAESFVKDVQPGTRIWVKGSITNRKRTSQKTGGEFDNVAISVRDYGILVQTPQQRASVPTAEQVSRPTQQEGDGLVDDLPF